MTQKDGEIRLGKRGLENQWDLLKQNTGDVAVLNLEKQICSAKRMSEETHQEKLRD